MNTKTTHTETIVLPGAFKIETKVGRRPLTTPWARHAPSLQLNQRDPIPVQWAWDVSRVPQPGVFQCGHLDHLQAISIGHNTKNRQFTEIEH
jgi:hypothetical protein